MTEGAGLKSTTTALVATIAAMAVTGTMVHAHTHGSARSAVQCRHLRGDEAVFGVSTTPVSQGAVTLGRRSTAPSPAFFVPTSRHAPLTQIPRGGSTGYYDGDDDDDMYRDDGYGNNSYGSNNDGYYYNDNDRYGQADRYGGGDRNNYDDRYYDDQGGDYYDDRGRPSVRITNVCVWKEQPPTLIGSFSFCLLLLYSATHFQTGSGEKVAVEIHWRTWNCLPWSRMETARLASLFWELVLP